MKKTILVIVAVLMLLAGCAKSDTGNTAKKNEIVYVPLTEDAQQMVNLLGESLGNASVLQFDYNVAENVASRNIWLDFYEYGELKNTVLELPSWTENPQPEEGRITLVGTGGMEQPEWRIQVEPKGEAIVAAGGDALKTERTITSSGGTVGHNPIPVELEKDIVLAAFYYGTEENSTMNSYDAEYLQENMEALKDQEYAVVVKCRFSAEVPTSINS